jgi:hypothetical protein
MPIPGETGVEYKIDGKMVAPAVVCAAFSAEIGLKALLIKEGNFDPDVDCQHPPFPLFGKLSDHVQAAMIRAAGMDRASFELQLQNAKDVFVKWRYLNEIEHKSVNLDFVLKIVPAIESVARQAYPES